MRADLQILYARLKKCKDYADELAREKKRPINPVAIKLGLAEPDTQYYGIEAGENPAQHYYTHLLSMAERLFENETDAATYEETLRLMFGTKAYIMFTLDRVVGAIVKQVSHARSADVISPLTKDSNGVGRHEEPGAVCSACARSRGGEDVDEAADRV